MAVSAKIVIVASLTLLFGSGACAQQSAAPADHCEGTLCDLYYGSRGSAVDTVAKPVTASVPGVPNGATPLMAPSGGSLLTGNPISRWFGSGSSSDPSMRPPPPPDEPAAATNSYMHMGSGGLLGDTKQRCSGTLCDTLYGSSPSEPTAPESGQRQAAATTAGSSGEPAIAYRHIPHESETRPKCSSPAADPWHCFRK